MMIMKTTTLITMTFFCANLSGLLAQNDPNCGIGGPQKSSLDKSKLGIINGEDAGRHEFPWQGSIQGLGGEHECGCSILNKRWLITAAHCVMDGQVEDFQIALNIWNVTKIENSTIVFNLSKIIINPDCVIDDPHYFHNDIALLKLSQDLDLQKPDSHIGPICLPEQQNEPMDKYAGKWATSTGWGVVEWDGIGNLNQTNEILKKVNLTIWRQEFCIEAYANSDGPKVMDDMICASDYEKGVCSGDSGGPLVTYQDGRWTLQGITSWVDHCAKPYHPSVYTRVTKFVDWIWATVKDN